MESKIIEKVQNLLELAYDAPNDEEGQTALLIAQRLIVKHNLSMTDVTTTRKRGKIGETVGTWAYRLPWWQEQLAGILGKNFRCKTIRRRLPDDGITQIIFFGYDADAELCTKVYEGAILYLKYRLKRLFPKITKARWKDYKKSYLLGFLEGLDQRFKAQTCSSAEFALMVQIPAEVIEEQRFRMGDLKSRVFNATIEIDSEAFVTGFEHAKETKLMPEDLLQHN